MIKGKFVVRTNTLLSDDAISNIQTVKRKEATKRTENERKPVDIGCTTTYNETF